MVELLFLFGIFLVTSFIMVMSRYRKCPSDKIMVVYGNVGSDESGKKSAKCIHGGAAFVWPVIQGYQYLDLTPMSIDVKLENALSNQNIRIDAPSRFTVGISTDEGVMQNAAERLLGLRMNEIEDLARDIIFGQLRVVVATMSVEEINSDRDKFLASITDNVEDELKKIGLRLINVNVTDISDESGYIKALGKEAAAKAVNDARKSVAEKERDGSVGEANAQTEQRIKVAEANARAEDGEAASQAKVKIAKSKFENEAKVRVSEEERTGEIGEANAQKEKRVEIAKANSVAIEGENMAKISIAESEAVKREKEAEALRRAVAAENIQRAEAARESCEAEKKAELARAEKRKAAEKADVIVPAEIAKEKAVLDSEAIAEKTRREAKGEADALYEKMSAEARGIEEILTKQAEGFSQIVKSAGGDANAAVKMMLVDKIETIVAMQVEAIKNIQIDKVTVWDSGSGADGSSSIANFMSSMINALPPLHEIVNMAGLNLPDYLGSKEQADMQKGEIAREE